MSHYLSRFSYRQRYIAWMIFVLLCLVLPVCWLWRMETQYLSRVDLQLRGVQEGRALFKLYDTVLDDYVRWASQPLNPRMDDGGLERGLPLDLPLDLPFDLPELNLPELDLVWNQIQAWKGQGDLSKQNGLYLKVIETINRAIIATAFRSELVLQNEIWLEKLVKGIYFRLAGDSAMVAEIYALSVIADLEDDTIKRRIEHFRQHVMKSKIGLESAYTFIDSLALEEDGTLSNARQQLLDIYRWDSRFIEAVKENIILGSGKGIFEAKILAYRVMRDIKETRNSAEALLLQLLNEEQASAAYQRLITVVALFSLIAVFAIAWIFRLLSGHFIIIQNYIKELSRGNFNEPLYVNRHEELGQFALALKVMGGSIQQMLLQMRDRQQKLALSTSHIAAGLDEERHAEKSQKKAFNSLQECSQGMAELSRGLANAMDAFAAKAKQQLLEDQSEEMVAEMHAKLKALVEASEDILARLSEAQDKVMRTHAIAGFMAHVSDQAASLSLKADIEVLHLGADQTIFRGITGEIHHFSDAASTSSEAIGKIIGEMSHSVTHWRAAALKCAREMTQGANSLVSAKLQIGRITTQDLIQTGLLQVINELMEKQAEIEGGLMDAIGDLETTLQEHNATVYKLDDAAAMMRKALKDLENALSALSVQGRV